MTAKPGDWVLMTHGLPDPYWWRCAEVLWARGDDFVVLDPFGTQPTHDPIMVGGPHLVSLVGTQKECEAARDAALAEEQVHQEPIRQANLTLEALKESRRVAIFAVVERRVQHMRAA